MGHSSRLKAQLLVAATHLQYSTRDSERPPRVVRLHAVGHSSRLKAQLVRRRNPQPMLRQRFRAPAKSCAFTHDMTFSFTAAKIGKQRPFHPAIQHWNTHMYDWRKKNYSERQETLNIRKRLKRPHHAPPHAIIRPSCYFVTGSCYEHYPHMDQPQRRSAFSLALHKHLAAINSSIHAWVVMPNHYHVLMDLNRVVQLRKYMGLLHGRTARAWNIEDHQPGRKVWFHSVERGVNTNRQFYRTVNYIHHNPVKAGLCSSWLDWPTSSAPAFLKSVGREAAILMWKEFPPND
jgi:putative transposase